MFSKPINIDTEPFPFSVLGGLLGNFSWRTLLEFRSTKLIPIALVHVICVVGTIGLMIFGLLIILLFDGSLLDNGIIAWFFALLMCVAIFVVGKRLLRELVAMGRLMRKVRTREKQQQQKLNDLKIHL